MEEYKVFWYLEIRPDLMQSLRAYAPNPNITYNSSILCIFLEEYQASTIRHTEYLAS
jgi:hypothetical protein